MTDPNPPSEDPDLQPSIGHRPSTMAPYAVVEHASRGRVHDEALPAGASPFELDRHRILNCTAYRRLMHKTQVFVTDSGDHVRTRLTHTLEVITHAEKLARRLHLNQRLAGAAAMAHDLGHPPFGHAGEAALAEAMKDHGGFEHNLQALRVVDTLEHPYPDFRGLNLTFEVRESLIRHRTPHDRPRVAERPDELTRPLLDVGAMPPLEVQVVNLADTIAYTLHDIEDGLLECGLTEASLNRCAIWRAAAAPVREKHPATSVHAVRRPILDNIATHLVEDAAAASLHRIREAGVGDADGVRQCDGALVAFTAEAAAGVEELQALLVETVYRNDRVAEMDAEARRLIRELFQAYLAEPGHLPDRFGDRIPSLGPHRVVCDYIAGMTDRFCREAHRQRCGGAGVIGGLGG